ncbi:hypothetical protein GUJ93_ZPchr0003g16731 [Zizania palustris]|uniref:Uncharacterized protein n=1 Tax=Zizania palustris TaxID=103762 RepID=A0A8J5SN52_ZIZPA|nr:hypothetical protein GUJ93_ZPchr0003g16731 [Zizania palustris]
MTLARSGTMGLVLVSSRPGMIFSVGTMTTRYRVRYLIPAALHLCWLRRRIRWARRNVVAPSGGEEVKRDGNGGAGIFGKLLSSSPNSWPVSVETEEERREVSDQSGEQAGILSAVASKTGIAMSVDRKNGIYLFQQQKKRNKCVK